MSLGLRILGLALLVTLVAWIGFFSMKTDNRANRSMLGDHGLFYSAKGIPSSAKAQIDSAIAVRAQLGRRYRAFSLTSDVAAWISFGATAVVTLLVGTFNLQRNEGPPQPSPRNKNFYLLGFLSAAASVATLLGNQAGKEASETLASYDKLHAQVIEAITVLKNKPDEEAKVLTDLSAAIDRYR